MALKKDQLMTMYKELVLIRRFEERAGELYAQKEIGGVYLHLANGQEAVIVVGDPRFGGHRPRYHRLS